MENDTQGVAERAPDFDVNRPLRQIVPLKGQCLVRLIPHDYRHGDLTLPDSYFDKTWDGKAFPRKARVIAIGPWRTTKQGYSILPDFHVGQTVLVSTYLGTKLTREIGANFMLVRVDDILAVLETELSVLS